MVLPFDSEEEAVAMTNDTDFGLSTQIWSRDVARAMRMARELDVSLVSINGGGGFDVEIALGGRQAERLRPGGRVQVDPQYSRVKSVWVDIGAGRGD